MPFSGTTTFVALPFIAATNLSAVRLNDREAAVMTRHDRFDFQKFVDCKRRCLRTHRETITDRNEGNLRLIDLGDQRHVGENIGIAEMIDSWLVRLLR